MSAINPDAVVQFNETAYSPTGSATLSASGVLSPVSDSGLFRPEFLAEGVAVKVLSPGGQWQEGTLRLALDFVPTTPTPTPPFPPTR